MPSRQQSISRKSSGNVPLGDAQSTEDIALAVIEAHQRWWALQLQAMEEALAENVQHSRSLIENSSPTTDAFTQWSDLYEKKSRRYANLTSAGLEIAAQAFAQINQLMEQLFSSYVDLALRESIRQSAATEQEGITDRRVAARIISFPDRRKDSGTAGHAENNARKRKVA